MNVDFRKDLSQIDECTVKEKGPGVLPKSWEKTREYRSRRMKMVWWVTNEQEKKRAI